MEAAASIAAVVIAYLVGSLSFAVIVSRAMGLADPRSYGSGNPGATNVLRSGNKAAAIATLALDALKGYLPVLAALLLADRFGWGNGTVAAVGLAAFLGHLWPVFFRFHGGKGVATAAGVLFAFNPLAFVVENVRRVVLWGRLPDWSGLALWSGLCAVVAVLGYAWFMKTKRGFADVL